MQVLEEFAIFDKTLGEPDAIFLTEGFERLSSLWRSDRLSLYTLAARLLIEVSPLCMGFTI